MIHPADLPVPVAEPSWRAVAARAASLLLRYPDADVLAAVPTIVAALDGLPDQVATLLRHVADHRATTGPAALATQYVELFDFRRRNSLHLTYYTAGDTRRRGEALVGFADAYRRAGLRIVDGELPDYLPAVLDLTTVDGTGWRLLRDHRVGLDLLARALAKDATVYRYAVEAVLAMLPPARPGDLVAAAQLARGGPPQESVGLEPFGMVDTSGGRR